MGLQATAKRKVISVKEKRHYIKDANAGKSKKKIKKLQAEIKEPKKEVLVKATGILVI